MAKHRDIRLTLLPTGRPPRQTRILSISIFRPCRRSHGVPISKLRHGSHATGCHAQSGSFQKREELKDVRYKFQTLRRSSSAILRAASSTLRMRKSSRRVNHDEVIATAVADARRVNARMHLWLATSTAGASASDAGLTQAARLQ